MPNGVRRLTAEQTTLDINDQLLADAKVLAARQRTSLTRLIDEDLQLRLRANAAGAGSLAAGVCAEVKIEVLAAFNEPGASTAAVALSPGLNANLVRKWLVGRSLKHTAFQRPLS